MCGIVGALTKAPRLKRLQEGFGQATQRLAHRGPDGAGQISVDHVMLGHRRLAIIDLSDAAAQPMLLRTGSLILVFNGEIYNFRQLHAQYLTQDTDINPSSDSSVLLGMYRRFGADMLAHLDGMFAFAIYDAATRRLFLARDRFGEKPLYYRADEEFFAFGSELQALRQWLGKGRFPLDVESLGLYLHFGSIPAPRTAYANVRALPPAHYAYVQADSPAVVSMQRYWQIGDSAKSNGRRFSLGDARAETYELLKHAVASRMVSDVPVGLFLSGGIDSGAIASVARDLGVINLRSVSVDFTEAAFSERALAEATARAFDLPLDVRHVDSLRFMAYLDGFFRAADQPTADGFNTYIVSDAARQAGGKVWLSGVGGDELFGGYPFFRRAGWLRHLARGLRLPLITSAGRLVKKHTSVKATRLLGLAKPGAPFIREYQATRSLLSPETVRRLLPSIDLTQLESDAEYVIAGAVLSHVPFNAATELETKLYMANQLLRDADNFSMAHSLEVRAPFLDHKLFDFVYSLPAQLKGGNAANKPLLSSCLARPLPQAVHSAPKRGFTFPVQIWMREHLQTLFPGVLEHPTMKRLVDTQSALKLWSAHMAGQVHWSVPWSIYSLGRWVASHEH